jgi:UDP-N-acetylglucosamine 4,6-dehydratase/5-epimerase
MISKNFFKNKTILITGGTGSFGNKFAKILLNNFQIKKLIIFSRDEMKQWYMMEKFNNNKIKFVIGDVREEDSITQASKNVDFIIHAAATKIVPTAETNPFECIKTNVLGAQNIINAAKINNVKKVVALSTDKACNPINLYGASKLASDKLFISANNYPSKTRSTFSVVRYGNVIGSRGSIIPFFLEKIKENIFPITHYDMTRFLITLEEGVNLVFLAFKDMKGGELYVSKIPSVNIRDLPYAINKSPRIRYIGIRPGEKIHEKMISEDDAYYTYEYKNYFKILPNYVEKKELNKYVNNGKKVKTNFSYSSNNNKVWVTDKQLKVYIKKIKKELDL